MQLTALSFTEFLMSEIQFMSFYKELDNLSLDELKQAFFGEPIDGEEYTQSYFFDEVACLIAEKGPAGLEFLSSQIEKVDTVHLAAILLALYTAEEYLPNTQLLSYLKNDQPIIVMQAINDLSLRQCKDALEQVEKLLEHPSPLVRSSCLRYFRRITPENAVPLLLASLNDIDFIVREEAIDSLDELDAVEAIPYLKPFLRDSHPDVRQAAETALKNLSESSKIKQN